MKIAVLGNVFVDYKGWSGKVYDPVGRNIGKVGILHGGVGRNVAENLACLGQKTYFITTLSSDDSCKVINGRLLNNDVNLDYCSYHADHAIGVWLAILSEHGDLLGSITQLPDFTLLEKVILDKLPQAIADGINHIAMDIDLTEKIAHQVIECIKANPHLKLYALPGNLSVISSNKHFFEYMECFICNDIEAAKLLGNKLDPSDIQSMQQAALRCVKEFNLKQIVITLGVHGSVYAQKDLSCGYQSIYEVEVVDSTGAGDAFFSATVSALMSNKPLSEAVQDGAKLAGMIISCSENTCTCMNIEGIRKK